MYHKKEEGENFTIETRFDKFDNKFAMLEASKKVDEDKVTKENNISLLSDPTASFQSGIVDT